MSTRKHSRELVAYAKELGIRDAVVHYRGKHPQIRGLAPSGKRVRVGFSLTPSDQFARRKIEADIRRAAQG